VGTETIEDGSRGFQKEPNSSTAHGVVVSKILVALGFYKVGCE
jgi:hypothetical protein